VPDTFSPYSWFGFYSGSVAASVEIIGPLGSFFTSELLMTSYFVLSFKRRRPLPAAVLLFGFSPPILRSRTAFRDGERGPFDGFVYRLIRCAEVSSLSPFLTTFESSSFLPLLPPPHSPHWVSSCFVWTPLVRVLFQAPCCLVEMDGAFTIFLTIFFPPLFLPVKITNISTCLSGCDLSRILFFVIGVVFCS